MYPLLSFLRIASTQIVVTAKLETAEGQVLKIRQSTEPEGKLQAFYTSMKVPWAR